MIWEPSLAWRDQEGFLGKVTFNLRPQGEIGVGEYSKQRESMSKGTGVGAASCVKYESKPVGRQQRDKGGKKAGFE